MLCAGYGKENPSPISGCNGDSGGPFVCLNRSGDWVLQGAVSWGDYKCRGSPTYSVFTRISSYVDWIQEQTKPRGRLNTIFFGMRKSILGWYGQSTIDSRRVAPTANLAGCSW